MSSLKGPLRIEIDTQIARRNMQRLQTLFPSLDFIAVVKEDAYGHGMVEMARLAEEESLAGTCVIFVHEGVHLREEGITIPIYLLGHALPHEIPAAIEHKLIIPLSTQKDIDTIAEYLSDHPTAEAFCSLAINTGMNRYGFSPEEAPTISKLLLQIPRLHVVQVYSHLTNADEAIDPYSKEQFTTFKKVLKELPLTNYKCSLANSAALLRHPHMRLDQIRIGCLLHGIPPIEGEDLPPEIGLAYTYRCTTTLNHIHKAKANASIGYGRTFTLPEDHYIGVVAGGYGCGLAKSLANRGKVLIRGKRYPIIGNICMSQFMIDLGPTCHVQQGDTVVILGTDGEESIDIMEHANDAERNPLELLMNLSAHNTQYFI